MAEMGRTDDVGDLFGRVSRLIEQTRPAVATKENAALTLMNWKIENFIDTEVLAERRAEYAQEIVVTLSRQLSWSHFMALIAVEQKATRAFGIQQTLDARLSLRTQRELIRWQGFERRVIPNAPTPGGSTVPPDTFSGPYSLDFFGLKDAHTECDLGGEFIREMETFLLEVDNEWAFEVGSRPNRWRYTKMALSWASIGRRCHRGKSRNSGSRKSIVLRENESHAAHSVRPVTTRTMNE
ncbi:DUF1016 domain-containing protein [Rhodococcus ruber]|uniref:hypothetical protein n=1 Tax=Rhodococcus ruber TaxID=1830 RepID=UPI00193165D0|nr:hypothetical protein [Rhodococcus ruber]QRE80542.1 DUF1016 domain-containing protein [Rhodococcus ruber]